MKMTLLVVLLLLLWLWVNDISCGIMMKMLMTAMTNEQYCDPMVCIIDSQMTQCMCENSIIECEEKYVNTAIIGIAVYYSVWLSIWLLCVCMWIVMDVVMYC